MLEVSLMPAPRWRPFLASLLLLALFGCADGGTTQQKSDRTTGRLFARAYDEVANFYIEPVTPKDVAIPALKRLSTIDPALSVSLEGGDVVLRDAAAVERFPQADARDARGWGDLTAAILAAADHHSPTVSAMPVDRRDKTLFSGITGTLDRFSRYSSPEAAREEHASREGFEGIGVSLDYTDDEVRIAAVIPGGPAERAGLQIDDRIVAIEGEPTASMSHEDVVKRLRGPTDSHVDVTLMRKGEPVPLTRTVARAYIVVPTVTTRREGPIAIVRIASFNEHTTDVLREEFGKVRKAAHGTLRGIVLDLRGNPGGLLDQGVSVADSFMSSGRIISTVGRNPGSIQEWDARYGDIGDGLPMAVVVNGGSASSAEIVAAALQDSGRAVVVGSSSYGKGTVQMVLRLPNDGELILTWARLVTPAGYILHEHGVVPSICTSGAGDDAASLAAVMNRSATFDRAAAKPRASLDEAGWTGLRNSCPGETKDHEVDLRAAERLLSSPSLYARLVHVELPAIAARPAARVTQ
jgi:carboxyl-terminal processing protease